MGRVWTAAAVVASVLFGCGTLGAPEGVTNEQACRDTADAYADYCERCERGSYSKCYDELIRSLADGDCKNITAIRDVNALYEQCLPWMTKLSCEDRMTLGILPDACDHQFSRMPR